jgi:GMP synthase (glutamine-hydrolysing)
VLALGTFPPGDEATAIVNRMADTINRVVALVGWNAPIERGTRGYLSPERLARLRRCDSIVRRLTHETGFDARVWQLPVVLIPVGTAEAPDSVVLRPIDSVDGMTAEVVRIPTDLLDALRTELLAVPGICAVFFDLTHKPPGTIEWE